MTHPYLALTDADREEMLRTVGVSEVEELVPGTAHDGMGIDVRDRQSGACAGGGEHASVGVHHLGLAGEAQPAASYRTPSGSRISTLSSMIFFSSDS